MSLVAKYFLGELLIPLRFQPRFIVMGRTLFFLIAKIVYNWLIVDGNSINLFNEIVSRHIMASQSYINGWSNISNDNFKWY